LAGNLRGEKFSQVLQLTRLSFFDPHIDLAAACLGQFSQGAISERAHSVTSELKLKRAEPSGFPYRGYKFQNASVQIRRANKETVVVEDDVIESSRTACP
jgi:hypothetical protein